LFITYAYGSRVSKAITSVCLFVCPHDNLETNDPKVFKLGTRDSWYDFWGQGSIIKVTVMVRVA